MQVGVARPGRLVHRELLVLAPSRGRFGLLCSLLLTALLGCAGRAGSAAGAPPSTSGPSLRIADEDLTRAPRTVSATEAIGDLDRALYAFDQAYAGAFGRTRMPSDERVAALRVKLAQRVAW